MEHIRHELGTLLNQTISEALGLGPKPLGSVVSYCWRDPRLHELTEKEVSEEIKRMRDDGQLVVACGMLYLRELATQAQAPVQKKQKSRDPRQKGFLDDD